MHHIMSIMRKKKIHEMGFVADSFFVIIHEMLNWKQKDVGKVMQPKCRKLLKFFECFSK